MGACSQATSPIVNQIFYKNVNYIATYDRSVRLSHIPNSFWSLIKASFLAQLKKQGLTALRDTLISLLVKMWLGYEIVELINSHLATNTKA